MSTLILVRHGQATPFEADTDRLSRLGEAQARAVGEYLVAKGLKPTQLLSGPMRRQRETAALALEAAGGAWPEPEVDARLAEYDGDGLTRTLAPLLAERDADFARLVQRFERERHGPDQNRQFQRLLEVLADAWQRGEVQHRTVEDWAVYKARVAAALGGVLALPSGSTVLVFTSGGVIGLMVALALHAPDASALALNWRVRNASITRFTFGGGRLSLDSFNETAHLGPDLGSWR